MSAGHLLAGEIRRLASYLLRQELASLLHALGCEACRDSARRLLAPPEPPQPSSSGRARSFDYSGIWEALEAGRAEAVERVAAERWAAGPAIEELLELPPREREARIREEARFRTLPVAARLFERSLAVSADDLGAAESLARLGTFLLDRLDPGREPRLLVHELRARGWALVAQACFLSGDWRAVREAIENADQALFEAGFVVKRAGIRRLVAAIRLSERQAEEVFELVGRAIKLLLRALLGEPFAGTVTAPPALAARADRAPASPRPSPRNGDG